MSVENQAAKLQKGYYRVRKTWEDEDSQIGQYRLLVSAQKKADENPGYFVFSPAGIAIYPDDEETVEISDETDETLTEQKTVSEQAEPEEEIPDEDAVTEPTADEIAEAKTVALAEDEYPNDSNTTPILYARANTLLNVRAGNSLDADKITLIRKGEIAEVLEMCDNGWYRIKCEAAECGYAYVSNQIGTYFSVGVSLYTVQPADSLWKIAEKTLGSGTRYTDLKTVNNLNSNYIKVGMQLLIP
ncbi:MAG: LysM peptidoglycan-binding domain-containing protein [Lachnospiraceae bacterium]|nr:LysM peptidoglycan-binding domain-containing protein [Lachnospiraceae bacterium]